MIDPRYDAQFQRGYSATKPSIPEESQVDASDGGSDVDTADTTAPAEPAGLIVGSDNRGVNIADSIVDDFIAGVPGPTQRNPFRLALFAMGAGLLFIAGVLIYIQMQFQSSSSPDDFIPLDLNIACVPTLVLGSIAAFMAAIAVGGLRQR